MLDVRGLVPLETFYRFRFSWKCAVFRMTTGDRPSESLKLINCPCFIQGFRGEVLVTDISKIPDIAQTYSIVIPAKFTDRTTKQIITLQRHPRGEIYLEDYIIVTEFPYILGVISIRDPLFHQRHYEITAQILPDKGFYTPIPSSVDDMTPYVLEIIKEVFLSAGIGWS